jgi:DNA polymerase-3 subunit alpha
MKNLVSNSISDLANLILLKDHDFSLGGFVTAASDNISKNGKPWGQFTLEDYTGTYDFKIFGKDYESFMKFMQQGHFLLIKAAVQEKYNSPGELDVKIKQMNLLGNARDNLKSFTVNIPVSDISQVLAEEISTAVKNNSGPIEFRIRFIDKEKNISVDLFSRKYKIEITSEILDFVHNNELKYFVN